MPKFSELRKRLNFPTGLALVLLAITILRIPNFFEPYWYGDEGIYLTIGNALVRGSKMYAQIVDHKTPLIYYLAMVPSQLHFRILLFGWMIVTTTSFYFLALKLLKRTWPTLLSTIIFAVFTTLPWFEGNIPNGELFVMGFVIVGLLIVSHTRYFTHALIKNTTKHPKLTNSISLLVGGLFAGLAMLTKVPALFDAVAIFTIGYFHLVQTFSIEKSTWKNWFKDLRSISMSWLLLGTGVVVPIAVSLLYYISVGSGQDYLFFGLLYNFHYAGNWQLAVTHPLLVFFFTLPGKVTFLALVFILLTALKKFFTASQQFILGWSALALVASLLSNRPYPHYFLQALPPLSLAVGMLAVSLINLLKDKKKAVKDMFSITFSGALLTFFISLLFIMNVGLYPTLSYYQKFIALQTKQMSLQEYIYSFNYLMKDNYTIAPLIKAENPDYMFIWGTNPMLYALTQTRPVGKFTVAFHIEDLGVQEETMQALQTNQPEFIVVMKEQKSDLPGLRELLHSSYYPFLNLDNMIVWKKMSIEQV
jgi:hypothetical protein